MKYLALIALFFVLQAFAQPPPCQDNSEDCLALAPPWGEGGVALSYDIVTERTKLPVVAFTYDDEEVASFQGHNYKIPDQLYFNEVNRFIADHSFSMSKTSSEMFHQSMKSTSIGVSLSYDGVTLGGAFSRTKGQMKDLTKNDQSSIALVNSEVLAFTMSMMPLEFDDLHPALRRTIARLPTNCVADSDREKYHNFIAFYGTHFLIDCTYGGKQNITTSVDNKYASSRTEDFIKKSISASIGYAMESFKMSSDGFDNKTQVSDDFKAASDTQTFVVGGDPIVFQLQGYEAWLETLPPNPAKGTPARYGLIVYRSKLAPISMLFDDAAKRQCMDDAVLRYAA